jgi:NodT family efflux transporter outer membrane factor (OMF) lipoprotein
MKRLTGPALLALIGAGCSVNPAPVDRQLDTDIPVAWVAEEQASGETEVGRDWWLSFGDPTLETLILEALERNQDLRVAAARVEAAEALARIAGADLVPQASGDVSASRRKQIFVGLPIPGTGGVLSSQSTNFGVNLNVSWEADLWGRIRAGSAEARSTYEAAELDYEAARQSLAAQTAKAWFAVVESARQVDVARRTLSTRTTTLERIRRRYNNGLAEALELRFAISDRALAESLVAQREQQAEAARRALQLIVYQYPSGRIEQLSADTHLPTLPSLIPAGIPAELVSRRPDLAAAEARLTASGYNVTEARRALYPRLTLTGSAGRLSDDVEDLLDSDFSVWSIAGGLLAPIFQGGRLRAAVDLAEAQQEESLARYVQGILAAFSEVEQNLAAEMFLDRRDVALTTAVAEANQTLELAESRFAAGLVDYLAVLESQRQVLVAESQLLAVERQRLDARVDLHLALGGGWSATQTAPEPAVVSTGTEPYEGTSR